MKEATISLTASTFIPYILILTGLSTRFFPISDLFSYQGVGVSRKDHRSHFLISFHLSHHTTSSSNISARDLFSEAIYAWRAGAK
jgi:hypothetical protein